MTMARAWCAVALALTAIATPPAAARAQEHHPRRCQAVAHQQHWDLPPRWYDADGNLVSDTNAPGPAVVARRLAGSYSLLVVTSEGYGPKEVAEYRLELSQPSPEQTAQLHLALPVPLFVTLVYVRGAVGERETAELVGPNLVGTAALTYDDSYGGSLSFLINGALDTGTSVWITDVYADGTFAGQWVHDGSDLVVFPTPLGDVLEHMRGYLCAVPRR